MKNKKRYTQREKFGHIELHEELRTNEPEAYRNFPRMDAVAFDELLHLVTSLIQKKTTVIFSSHLLW